MPHMREVKTCDRCRHFKRRCDLLKPSCSRCVQAGIRCSFEASGATAFSASSTTSVSPRQAASGLPLASIQGLISPSTSNESPEPHHIRPGAVAPAALQPSDAAPQPYLDAPQPQDASGAAPPSVEGQRIIRKRKRNCLSCLRCHRLKVKCDKELPCSRCKSSGNGRECYYSYNKGPNGGKFPCPTAPVQQPQHGTSGHDANKKLMASWSITHQFRGSSHWRDLMAKISELAPSEKNPLNTALQDIATNACLANFTLPGNFPFGTPGATKYYSRDAVTRLLEGERPNCGVYIDTYVALLDTVNPILDVPQFRREVEAYWADPQSVTLCWLSHFLMVAGLGSFASAEEANTATELMMASEACLMQTPFMFRPTLMVLKTLALMVVAKQVCNATCWSVDSCWSLLGLLVRSAFIFGLPQEKYDCSPGSAEERQTQDSRRKLWLTILYLDIKVSMCTGMPPLTRPDELGDMNKMPDWGQPDSLQMVLYQSLPTVLEVMAKTNSKRDAISYPDVLRYNAQIRELMAHAQRVCTGQLQSTTVDIFLRRCLMVLHRPFALHQEGPVMFPESYWSSLECSLALLVHYRELWNKDNNLRFELVGRAFVLDFFSASLTTCVHLLREDAPLAGAAAMGCDIPPRKIMHDTMEASIDIWAGERERSVCYRTGYKILVAVLEMLPKL